MSIPSLDSNISTANQYSRTISRNNFDFCRFWLSILVIFAHSFALADGNEDHEPLRVLTNAQIDSGSLAVNCFFAISGYLITHSWLRSKSTTDFLLKRVLRIYPGFIVAVLIGLFCVEPIASEHFTLTIRNFLALVVNLVILRRTELSGGFPDNPLPFAINGSLWSIPYEFKCYLAVMLLGGLGLFNRRKWLNVILLIVFIIGGMVYPLLNAPFFERGAFAVVVGNASNWFIVFPYFLAGMTFYLFEHRIPASARWAMSAFIALVVAAMLPPLGRLIFPFAIPYVLFWLAFRPNVRLQNWACFGDFSYGIYLYAFPIQQLIVSQIHGIGPISLFLIATPLSVVAGVISWHLVEKHFLKLKHRLPSRSLNIAPN